jgi:type II secretion system protein C
MTVFWLFSVMSLMLNGFRPAEKLSFPYSNLPLDLVGVVVSSNSPSRSVCLIRLSQAPKNADLFQPGDKAFEIAEIQKIGTDGVIIKNLVSNTLEVLTFLKNKPLPAPLSADQSLPRVMTNPAGEIAVDISADILHHYTINLGEILNSAYAAPHFRNEKDGKKAIEGFEISRIKEGGIVGHLGFRNGDIILDVNGETLDSLEKVLKLVGQVQTMPQAELTVQRGAQRLKMVFHRK